QRGGERQGCAAGKGRGLSAGVAREAFIRDAHYPGRSAIDAYGNGGFRFADMSHRGSLLCLPSGIHGWNPTAMPLPAEEDFAPVFAEADRIDILLIGTGDRMHFLPPGLKARFRAAGIVAESMSSGAAV